MHILIYETHGGSAVDRLSEAIDGTVPREWVEVYQTRESLSIGLRRPLVGRAIAVLFARDLQDLTGLLSIGDLLCDIPLILVLGDRDRKTISAAHALRPRFLTFADSGFMDVAAVLGKMIEYTAAGFEFWQQKET
ncbi:MAG: hypothetical protein AB1512_07595 [Thermodesulfobacteriota bacterium]